MCNFFLDLFPRHTNLLAKLPGFHKPRLQCQNAHQMSYKQATSMIFNELHPLLPVLSISFYRIWRSQCHQCHCHSAHNKMHLSNVPKPSLKNSLPLLPSRPNPAHLIGMPYKSLANTALGAAPNSQLQSTLTASGHSRNSESRRMPRLPNVNTTWTWCTYHWCSPSYMEKNQWGFSRFWLLPRRLTHMHGNKK